MRARDATASDPLPWRPWWGSKMKMIFGHAFEASPHGKGGLGHEFWASIISTIGPSFLTFGHLYIIRALEWP